MEPNGLDWVQKYFILPLKDNMCIIDIEDDTNIDDITKSNEEMVERINCTIQLDDINNDENNYRSLKMVDGGIDLEEFLERKGKLNDDDFTRLNVELIDLLVSGIYEMNNLGIYHFDIKAGNIVYNETEGQMRLIDWGFARYMNKDEINEDWLDKKIHRFGKWKRKRKRKKRKKIKKRKTRFLLIMCLECYIMGLIMETHYYHLGLTR